MSDGPNCGCGTRAKRVGRTKRARDDGRNGENV